MKFKTPMIAVLVLSAALLSACGTAVTEEQGQQSQQQTPEQTENIDQGQRPSGEPGQKGPGMDLAAAAKKLNVTEEALKTALGLDQQNKEQTTTGAPKERVKMDTAAAAKKLNVTEEALKTALGLDKAPSGNPPSGAPEKKTE